MSQTDLTFKEHSKKIKGDLGKTEWVTVFSLSSTNSEIDRGSFFSALIANDKVDRALDNYQWEVRIDGGKPGFCSHFEKGEEITEYYRFSEKGVEPLVYWRTFTGNENDYFEISEEFRLYFDLYEDRKNSKDIKFIFTDSNGDENVVAMITKDQIQIKLKYLKEFLAAKQMCLAIYFDLMRFSKKTLNELKQKEINDVKRGKDYIYSICVRDLIISDTKTQGWLMGKKIINGLKNFKPDIFERCEEKKHEEFIIGIDDEGKEIMHTCEEEKLANFFGKNPGSPQFLTPVFFKREVLKKYYNNPEKYTVDDGCLHCKGHWGLRMDNDHQRYVAVFLGYLGHLHHKEQLYWKSFNIAHQGGISRTAWERGFQAKFTDPGSPDLYFKYKFEIFQKAWHEQFGWHLFKPLSKEDNNYFKSLHIPTTEDTKEFDDQILAINKILTESLNVEELKKGITIEKEKPSKLDILEAFLNLKSARFKEMFEFLNNLRLLKNPISHRKSKSDKGYKKAKKYFKFEEKKLPEIFTEILIKTIWTLNFLEGHFLKEKS